ncbi:M56 family metallopeptidase [Antribacter gilvus]|uniref:M56 family metallopeptidase n=1 Tax=Antribacter gilvus TaxID=2304675 RepID=UPI000F7B1C67|nr:M56 family metallopeptidase [Antribacter gilvus]
MTTILLLLLAVVGIGIVCGQLLVRAPWAPSAPRLTVASWHLLGLGSLASVLLAGLASVLLVAPPALVAVLGGFLAHCAVVLRSEATGPHGVVLGVAGMLLALVVTARLLGSLVRESWRARRERHEQLDRLALVGRRLPSRHRDNRILLDDARPAAYCLPGGLIGRGTIVVSSGTLALLDEDQVRLVLAHESAHLHQRHHLAIQLSVALAHAFGRTRSFRRAEQQVPPLLEMAADDGAVRVERPATATNDRAAVRRRLAHALVTLAGAQATPSGALGAGGSAVARVRRLSGPRVRLRLPQTMLLVAGAGLALAELISVVMAPAVCAAAMPVCVAGLG